MKKILALTVLMFSTVSFATSQLMDIDCPDCNYPPVSVSAPEFDYAKAEMNFKNAAPISPAELVGSWKLIAGAQIADVFVASAMMGYDEEGIPSKAKPLTLDVTKTTISGGFFEEDPTDKIEISILNLGDNSQGPYEVLVNEAGQACFSTKSYGSGRGYYSFECKKIGKSNAKILCAVTLNAKNSDLSSSQKPYAGKTGIYFGFVRK